MSYLKWVLAALCVLGAPCGAVAKTTLTLKPMSKWVVDFSIDRCTIVRLFGDDKDQTTLRISQFAPETSLELMLFGRHAQLPINRYLGSNKSFPLLVSFGPDTGLSTEIDSSQASTDESKVIIGLGLSFQPEHDDEAATHPVRSFVSDQQRPALGKMDRIEIGGAITRNLNLLTGSMEKVFAVLDDCTYNLMEEIGLDAEANRQRLSGPVADDDALSSIAKKIQRGYPRDSLREGRMAILRVRSIVEEDGSISDCVILGTTSTDGFGSGVCDTFRQLGRFSPAIGADGQPLRSWDVRTIRYIIP